MSRPAELSKGQRSAWLQDCMALVILVALASALYVPKLGFYSDDWRNLSDFSFGADQSLVGLVRSIFDANARVPESAETGALARPLQVLYFAALFQLFGLDPLGYHVVNWLVFVAGICAFYSALCALGADRLFAISVALVYSALPHYSSDRFWYAAFQANLSMTLYFFSIHACARLLTSGGTMRAVWIALAALSLLASALAYEVFLPLFVFGLLVVAIRQLHLAKTSKTFRVRPGDLATICLGLPLLIGLVVYYKLSVTSRAGSLGFWLVNDALSAAFELTLGAYGVKLPHIFQVIFHHYLDWRILAVSVASTAASWLYLRTVLASSKSQTPAASTLLAIAASSVVIAGLSYAYFYGFFQVNTGINNRAAIAASACVALFWVSGLSLALGAVWRRRPGAPFCFVIAVVYGCGTLIVNTIATSWIEASRAQAEVMRELRSAWPRPPAGSSVLLAGVCSWVGPGIVFEIDWDVSGATRLLYRDPTLRGEVLRPWMTVGRDGLRNGDTLYSYASLYVYDGRTKTVRVVGDESAAAELLARVEEGDSTGCAGNYKAFGAGLLIW